MSNGKKATYAKVERWWGQHGKMSNGKMASKMAIPNGFTITIINLVLIYTFINHLVAYKTHDLKHNAC